MKTSTLLTSSLGAALAAYYWGEFVYRTMTVVGVFRWHVPNMYADDDIIYIEDTQHCEDGESIMPWKRQHDHIITLQLKFTTTMASSTLHVKTTSTCASNGFPV